MVSAASLEGHPGMSNGLLCKCWSPAETEGVGPVVVFALDWEFFAALVKAKDLVRKIKERGNKLKIAPMRQAIHDLSIDLGVGVEVE